MGRIRRNARRQTRQVTHGSGRRGSPVSSEGVFNPSRHAPRPGKAGPAVVVAGENPGALHIVDRNLRILAFNEAFSQWNRELGLPTDVVGRRLPEVFPFLPEGVFEEYRRVFDHGQILISQETNTVGDKDIVTETHKIPVFEGRVVARVVTIVRDITARKSAEKAVARYQAQLKALASKLKMTEDRERRRLAAELHDRVTQGMAVSKLEAQSLWASIRNGRVKQSLARIIEGLNNTLQETQSLTSELSYPILGVLGLETAIAQYLKEVVEKKHGLATEFRDDGLPKPLDEDLRSILFRDVRELLVNVVKHARAHRVRVAISRVGEQIQVCVEDDGIGLDADRMGAVLCGGFGLLSIQEGIGQLGGHLAIQSVKDQGTQITLTAPLAPPKKGKSRSSRTPGIPPRTPG